MIEGKKTFVVFYIFLIILLIIAASIVFFYSKKESTKPTYKIGEPQEEDYTPPQGNFINSPDAKM